LSAAAHTPSSWLAAYPALRDKLAKLGIRRPADLVTHLPLRYEDRTHLTPLDAVQPGVPCLIEGTVRRTEVHFRPRRQLVTLLTPDGERGGAEVVLRFLHFYPNHQKTLQPGRRVRAFGEARPGFFGLEMIHPTFSVVDPAEPLPEALTPVYPTTAGLAQSALRKLILRQVERDSPLVADTLPAALRER
jgi:ATP-dependent DNA helicase RecG